MGPCIGETHNAPGTPGGCANHLWRGLCRRRHRLLGRRLCRRRHRLLDRRLCQLGEGLGWVGGRRLPAPARGRHVAVLQRGVGGRRVSHWGAAERGRSHGVGACSRLRERLCAAVGHGPAPRRRGRGGRCWRLRFQQGGNGCRGPTLLLLLLPLLLLLLPLLALLGHAAHLLPTLPVPLRGGGRLRSSRLH